MARKYGSTMEILIVYSGLLEKMPYGVGTTIKGFEAELNKMRIGCDTLSKEWWSLADEIELQSKIKRVKFILKILGMKELDESVLAERWVFVSVIFRFLKIKKNYTHIWFQDPLIAFFFKIRSFFSFEKKYNIIISQHNSGSSARALVMEGYKMPKHTFRIWCYFEKKVMAWASLVIAPSDYARTLICRDLGFLTAPANLKTIRNGRPTISKLDKHTARTQLGLPHDSFLVLIVGRVATIKNTECLIKAARKLSEIRPKIRFIFVGTNENDMLAHGLKEGDKNILLFNYQETSPFYSAADVYLSAATEESYGHANVESIGYGLPTIVGAGGAAVEIGKYGFEYLSPDPDSISSSLVRIHDDSLWRNKLRQAALARFESLPNWSNSADEFIAALKYDLD